MNIQPTSGIASLAGTARAQAHGSDSERRSPAADAAVDPRLSEVAGIEAGTKSQDRDADGRQLLQQDQDDDSPDSRDENSCSSAAEESSDGANKELPPPTREGAGTHIDFEA